MKKSKKVWTSAVVVAAGKGTRMNMDINKQYIDIDGYHCLQGLSKCLKTAL